MEKSNAVTGDNSPHAKQGLGDIKTNDPKIPVSPLNTENPTARPLQYLDFPFFTDTQTKEYIGEGNAKLMIILRGAPGSGKTVISQELQRVYGASIGVRAPSANDFWIQNPAGFEENRLSEAHGWCRKECELACKTDGVHMVIIDNTNVEHWEFQVYLDMARRYGFVVLFIAPQTPWRYDVELLHSIYNVHNVNLSRIQARVKKLKERPMEPMFYGWFFSAVDSLELERLSVSLARKIASTDYVKKCTDGNGNGLLGRVADIPESTTWKEGKELLYAASCHTRDDKGDKVYSAKEYVKNALGRVYELKIVGLLVTKKSASFHVNLAEDQIKLWDHVDGRHPGLPWHCAHINVHIAAGVERFIAGVELRTFLADTDARSIVDLDSGVLKSSAKLEDSWYLELKQPIQIQTMFVSFVDPDPEVRTRKHGSVQEQKRLETGAGRARRKDKSNRDE